jgi:hypothetical protein
MNSGLRVVVVVVDGIADAIGYSVDLTLLFVFIGKISLFSVF